MKSIMYAPAIQSARAIKLYKVGAHEAAFLSEIVSDGVIGYKTAAMSVGLDVIAKDSEQARGPFYPPNFQPI
jgi:hypothetical protein